MLYIKWFILAIATLVIKLLAWILAPFLAAYSVIAGINVLPGIFRYLSTVDDTLDGGQHQAVQYEKGVTGVKLWWQRTRWIMRNPAHGLEAEVFGLTKESVAQIVYSTQGPNALAPGNTRTKAGSPPGYYTMKDKNGKTIGWGVFVMKPWLGNFVCKIWFGWAHIMHDRKHYQIELQFNPFMRITKS